jgi:subtilase family serine protease
MSMLVRVRVLVFFALVWGWWLGAAFGQAPVNRIAGPGRTIETVNQPQQVTLAGNVHPLARWEFDEGVVQRDTPLDRMVLLLKSSPERQAELDALVEAQHDAGSPLFHEWLTPAEFGARFGAGGSEIGQVVAWLEGYGFRVDEIAASNRLILFSGTGAQVDEAFHAAMHRYKVDGMEHIANSQDPQIPMALAGSIGGIVSLHDFRRVSQIKGRKAIGVRPEYSAGATHYLFPADFATIYDLNPLYGAGKEGTGTSIAIAGRSDIDVGDVAAFRTISGLNANAPQVVIPGTNPGLVAGDQDESTLDVEWSGAVAPAATVNLVVEASTATTDGVDLSAAYIVNHSTAPVVSTSYGNCEQEMGTAELAFYNSLWEQAASQGMSMFVAAGDAGAAGCNTGSDSLGSVAAVNGLCSSPYSTCVGGTEFNEGSSYLQYWSVGNSSSYESALSYIPEEVWNESALDGGSGLWASGGRVSAVYAEPAWQREVTGTASAEGGMRMVPDVALSAADHDGYVICENGMYWVISGTSAASPAFAAIMALVVESQGGKRQGNANAGLYPLVHAVQNPFHATPMGNNSVQGVAGFTASDSAYNLATGLGSVDAALLVGGWSGEPSWFIDLPVRHPIRRRCARCEW